MASARNAPPQAIWNRSTSSAAAAVAPRRPAVPRMGNHGRADASEEQHCDNGTCNCIACCCVATEGSSGPSRVPTPFSLESVLPPVPKSFKCPITHEVMRNPVMTQDGHVYENDAIQEWFRRGHRTSPVTGMELLNLALLPEVPLRRAIEEYMALRPEIARRELNLRSDLLTLRNVTAALEKELQAKRHSEASKVAVTTPSQMVAELADSPQSTSANHSSPGLSGDDIETTCSPEASPCAQDNTSAASRTRTDTGTNAPPQHPLAGLPTPCRNGCGARPRGYRSPAPPNEPAVLTRTSSMQVLPHRTTKLHDLMKAVRTNWRGNRGRGRWRSQSREPR